MYAQLRTDACVGKTINEYLSTTAIDAVKLKYWRGDPLSFTNQTVFERKD